MRQETQIQLTKRVLAHIAAQGTDRSDAVTHHPVSLYTCPGGSRPNAKPRSATSRSSSR